MGFHVDFPNNVLCGSVISKFHEKFGCAMT